MTSIRRFIIRGTPAIVCLALGMCLAGPAAGQETGQETGRVSAAGPRTGPIAVLEATVPDRAGLEDLVRRGFDIDAVFGRQVLIYATLAERETLDRLGAPYRVLEWQPGGNEDDDRTLGLYHNYTALTAELEAFAAAYPDICRLRSLGPSVQGRQLWALLITDNPDDEEDEPEFKYVSTMHGDEPVGTENCLYFIHLLLNRYNSDPRITQIVNETAVWIVPLMNPDGRDQGIRYNANGYDLNRSFPVWPSDYAGTIYDGVPMDDDNRQPEVAHVMRWSAQNSFVLAANFHTGALVTNYPYDDNGLGSIDSPTPDDLLFEDISRRYSQYNAPMWNSPYFFQGITNGAAWYVVYGGMQDWNYRYLGCNETTIELSYTKWPSQSTLIDYWANNQESMLRYLEAVHIGIRGRVTDGLTGQPLWAKILVAGNSHPVFTDPDVGDYHRMLLPGVYTVTIHCDGYVPRTFAGVTVTDGPAVRLDAALLRADRNGDGRVDGRDYALLGSRWLDTNCGECGYADLSGDGNVSMVDLYLLLADWLADTQAPSPPAGQIH
ncbi:MAG: carboxypeptidase regulatory-like domain-containing protein [Sedimentisphaerales bacterium]|nr:carboxypeptidase regulatory-like domain-containing protein [Sedimentisphaerales bacterium]